jgi:hypothetical protein
MQRKIPRENFCSRAIANLSEFNSWRLSWHGVSRISFLTEICVSSFRIRRQQGSDNIHSLDPVNAFVEFARTPRAEEGYNIGGSSYSNCWVQESIELCDEVSQGKLAWSYTKGGRVGDHS